MDTLLKYGVILSFLFSVVSLVVLVLKTFSFGKKHLYAKPQGSNIKGIFYAFGQGMMPWEKESTGKHLPTYIMGVIYHTGIFAALFYLFSLIFSLVLSKPLVYLLWFLITLGFISGLTLFFKRIFFPIMRKISCPDDFASNAIVNLFLICAFLNIYSENVAAPFFLLVAIMMFLYIPVGKIRHCFFFFYVRILFGIFYGRRNILPPKTNKV